MDTTATRADRLALRLDRLPRGARAGLLAVSIAATFALVGTGAQASPVKDAPAPAPTGPSVILDPVSGLAQGAVTVDPHASFLFKSETSTEFECSLDDADYKACASPADYILPAGAHHFRVRALDRSGEPDVPAQRDWAKRRAVIALV